MILHIEIDQEVDGRWLAEVTDLPGVMAYGVSRADAVARVQALALGSLAEPLDGWKPFGTS
ncbi:MAG: type II toxin-antitoxin system HicB family antitoxin [Gemmatimonadetes bacterium]|nr:type II toxin-antitoxin system HicB family antitoxin [Gemmatimonadota bacterium]MCB9519238.1 type II toxin-antitoxin system HicB family antitoxin [Gemmatimonadales bacterium]